MVWYGQILLPIQCIAYTMKMRESGGDWRRATVKVRKYVKIRVAWNC